jgi:hypothetical protein
MTRRGVFGIAKSVAVKGVKVFAIAQIVNKLA